MDRSIVYGVALAGGAYGAWQIYKALKGGDCAGTTIGEIASTGLKSIHKQQRAFAAVEKFANMDLDGSGCLSISELKSWLSCTLESEAVEELFKMCDTDGSRSISMIEYVKGMKKWKKQQDAVRKSISEAETKKNAAAHKDEMKKPLAIFEGFSAIDLNGDGTVCISELRVAMKRDNKMTEEEITDLFAFCDEDHSGNISVIEYFRGLKRWKKHLDKKEKAYAVLLKKNK